MKVLALATGATFTLLAGAVGASSPGHLDQLKVLFVGESADRTKVFEGFLAQNVGQVATTSRHTFKPAEAEGYDVVLLDWGQSEQARDERSSGRSPLGAREQWSKPTVLLGSAGLNLAVVWKVRGGSG
jgi:hypothetical protein